MPRVWFQKGWLDPGDRRLGLIVDKRAYERFPTIDVCWWWGWVMIHFTRRE